MNAATLPPALNRPPEANQDLHLDVQVTDSHIDLGQPSNCRGCPVALALLSACDRVKLELRFHCPVSVYGDHALVLLADQRLYVGALPASARSFIRHFDRGPGRVPGPFDFRLKLQVHQVPEAF